jgi:hypothetical protein
VEKGLAGSWISACDRDRKNSTSRAAEGNRLDAKKIGYERAASTRKLSAADVGDIAKKFTVLVECWR